MKPAINQTTLITGISSGIGLALAKLLLNKNHFVIGTTKSGHLENFDHENLTILQLDINSDAQRKSVAAIIESEATNIDLLINNAGIAPDVFQEEPDLESFTQTITTNLTSTVFFTELLLKKIPENGKIIFISSEMGLIKNADKTGTAYRISKTGINMYSEILARRLSENKINVAAIHPGWVKTKLGGNEAPTTPDQSAEAILRQLENIAGVGKFYNAESSQIVIY